MLCYKRHERIYKDSISVVVAICDAGLIGKKLKSKTRVLDLETYGEFYNGEKISRDACQALLTELLKDGLPHGTSLNLVGKETMRIASEFVNVSNAHKFKTVPHLQVYSV